MPFTIPLITLIKWHGIIEHPTCIIMFFVYQGCIYLIQKCIIIKFKITVYFNSLAKMIFLQCHMIIQKSFYFADLLKYFFSSMLRTVLILFCVETVIHCHYKVNIQ